MVVDFFNGEPGWVDCDSTPDPSREDSGQVIISLSGTRARILCVAVVDGRDHRIGIDLDRTELYGLAGFFLANFPELPNAALIGAEGVRAEGTVRGENPGKDEQ